MEEEEGREGGGREGGGWEEGREQWREGSEGRKRIKKEKDRRERGREGGWREGEKEEDEVSRYRNAVATSDDPHHRCERQSSRVDISSFLLLQIRVNKVQF